MEITKYIQKYIGDRKIEGQSPYIWDWYKQYKGYDKDFHEYTIYNGDEEVKLTKKSLNIAKKSCEDYANLLLNEKCDVIIKDKEKLDEILYQNNFWAEVNAGVEKGFALSMFAVVEGLENVSVNEDGELIESNDTKVVYDYVNALNIYPISFKRKKIVECAFASSDTYETNIAIHVLNEDGLYDVINVKVMTSASGEPTGEEYSYIFHTGYDKPLFHFIRPNICNNKDIDDARPISIYANSIDTLRAIDNAYDSFDTEIQYGRKRIFADERMMAVDADGNPKKQFSKNDVVIYRLPERADGKELLTDYSPALRIMDISTALQEQLNTYASMVGFGKNYYTFGGSGGARPIQTATGIIAQNSDLFRSIKKHEILLEQFLKELVEATAYLVNTFTTDTMEVDDINVKFDDSIIEDTESEKASDRTDLANGIISLAQYRAKWYGEELEVAEENIKSIGLNGLDSRINALLPALQNNAIDAKGFVEACYLGYDDAYKNALIDYITTEMTKSNSAPISLDSLGINFNE